MLCISFKKHVDSVAPELCIDFDAQHFTRMQGLAMWCGGLAFFASFYTLISCTEPPKLRKAVRKKRRFLKT